MAWAPLIGTMDTPSAFRSRPDRRAASVKASSSVTPSTRTIVRTVEYCPHDGTRDRHERRIIWPWESAWRRHHVRLRSPIGDVDRCHEPPKSGWRLLLVGGDRQLEAW